MNRTMKVYKNNIPQNIAQVCKNKELIRSINLKKNVCNKERYISKKMSANISNRTIVISLLKLLKYAREAFCDLFTSSRQQ